MVYVGVCMLLLVSFTGGGFVARYRQDFLVFRDSDADMVVLEKVGDWLVVAPLNLQQKTYEPIYRFLPLPSDRTTARYSPSGLTTMLSTLPPRNTVWRSGRLSQPDKVAPSRLEQVMPRRQIHRAGGRTRIGRRPDSNEFIFVFLFFVFN